MTKFQAVTRIKKLRVEINRHRYLYHVLDKPDISDAAHDSLKNELVELERQFPELITPDSPTQRVGGEPLPQFIKVVHRQPVLSLQDVFSQEEIEDWIKRNEKLLNRSLHNFFCELKLDGLTCVLTYRNGVLAQAATRGDGQVGEDVTQNIKTIESVPLRLRDETVKIPGVVEVRGEVVMSKKVFEELNKILAKKNENLFANPRNAAAGSIRQLDPKIAASRKLDLLAFELITDCGQTTHEQAHQLLKELGFKVEPHSRLCKNISEVWKFLQDWEVKRQNLSWQTDGSVIVINDLITERQLGSVGKAERWMVAYKFPAEQATTVVEDIIVQVGRTGTLTPVALLKPVRLAGTTVSRATLHNADEIKRLDVRIGDTVIVQKAGDIIPDIVQILPRLRPKGSKPFNMPRRCPVCGAEVVKEKKDEVNLRCSNKHCYAMRLENIIHFASRKAMDIEGLGDKIVAQLMEAGLVRDIADLFNLTEVELGQLPGFAELKPQKLVKAIQAAKRPLLSKFIFALGIRHVGEETAQALAKTFTSLGRLQKSSLDQLLSVPDIGPVVAKSIYDYFNDSHNLKLLDHLQGLGVKPRPVAIISGPQPLRGKIYVLTGTLPNFTREQAKAALEQRGAEVTESVSRKTTGVITGIEPGFKFNKAQQLGVPILDEDDLKKLLK